MSSIGGVLRNAQLRGVELAWGASIVAEWANFVALGVFAYHVGGTLAVGIAGLVRLLPAALVAPFAAFVGDRFRRERFLVAISAGGCLALAGSAAVSWGTQTQSRTESGRFAGRSNKCTPRLPGGERRLAVRLVLIRVVE